MDNSKKYLFLVGVLVIIGLAAIILSISQRAKQSDKVYLASTQLQEAQAQSYVAKSSPELAEDDLIFGSKKAQLVVFVYEDYSSQYSAELADTLERIRQEANKDVAIVIRPYASESDPLSRSLSLAVACAAEQEKWQEMRALIFSQVKNSQLPGDNLSSGAQSLEIKMDQFNSCLTNDQKSERIEELIAQAKTYEVLGAPTLFIGQEMVLGARPYEDFVDSNGDTIEGLSSLISRRLQ